MRPVLVFCEESYFYYKCGNLDLSFDWVRKLNSYRFMCSSHATTVTCVLLVSIMADSHLSLMHVMSESCVYSNCVI
jgi:hypothetical protein